MIPVKFLIFILSIVNSTSNGRTIRRIFEELELKSRELSHSNEIIESSSANNTKKIKEISTNNNSIPAILFTLNDISFPNYSHKSSSPSIEIIDEDPAGSTDSFPSNLEIANSIDKPSEFSNDFTSKYSIIQNDQINPGEQSNLNSENSTFILSDNRNLDSSDQNNATVNLNEHSFLSGTEILFKLQSCLVTKKQLRICWLSALEIKASSFLVMNQVITQFKEFCYLMKNNIGNNYL